MKPAEPDYPVNTTAARDYPVNTTAARDNPVNTTAARDYPVNTTAEPDLPVKAAAAESDRSLTAAEVLFGPSADTSDALSRHILSAGDVRHAFNRLSRSTRQAAVREATAATAALLKVDLLGVLVSGWRDHREIMAAARRTLTAVSSRELVSLPPHRVATAQQPSVSILVDGKKVAFLRLGLSIIADVEALVAGISTGRLSAVHAGRCSIGVALTVHDLEVLTKRAHLDLPGAFRLKSGIRLLAHSEYPHGTHPGLEIPVGPQESHFPAVALGGSEHPGAPATGHPGVPATGHLASPAGEHLGAPGSEHPGAPAESHPPRWWENTSPDRRG